MACITPGHPTWAHSCTDEDQRLVEHPRSAQTGEPLTITVTLRTRHVTCTGCGAVFDNIDGCPNCPTDRYIRPVGENA